MTHESSDILGGRPLNNDKSDETSVFFRSTGFAALALFAWLAWFRGRVVFLKWKETRYKKAMRRRHGIPDEDERPFNVAYAAAVRAREREDEGGSVPGATGRRLRNALAEGQQSLWRRFDDVAPQIDATSHWNSVNTSVVPQITQAYAQIKQQQQNGVEADPLDFEMRYDPNPPAIRVPDFNHDDSSSRPTVPFQQVNKQKLHSITDHVRKRSFDYDDDDLEPTKKSRVEGEELIDGDEDAAWAFKRGSKRGLTAEDDDEGYESTRGDKRPRNTSRDKTPEDQVMEDDEADADDVAELRSVPRGKKRDRAEAGSTFGGDDDDEIDGQMEGKASRSRKRKMISKRKSDAQAQARGRKRNRDADIGENEDEGDDKKLHISRKKRGKKGREEDGDGSDVSMSDSLVSRGSYVKGRKIGEEWEVNGVLYKVGINGQRLRQALVKKARNKFPMPKDSQHPDREANLEVFVETWLTEDEYKEAKEHNQLAWQDSPKRSVEPETPGDVTDSPSMKGKNLLWASAAAQESPAPKRRFRESIATTVGLHIDAFPDAQTTSRRRVASAYSPLLPGGTGVGESHTTRKGGFRTFSKWEKQDLEAEAMAKMRAKLEDQKKASLSSDPKSVGLSAPPLATSASAPGPLTASFGNPTDKPTAVPVAGSFSLGGAPISNKSSSSNKSAKPLDAARTLFPFSASPPSGDDKSQPSMSFNKPAEGAPPSFNTSSMPCPPLPTSQPDPSKSATISSMAPPSVVPGFFGLKTGSSTAPASGAPGAQAASAPATKAPVSGFNASTGGLPSAQTNPSSSPFSFSNTQADKTSTSPFTIDAQSNPKKSEAEIPTQNSESGGSMLGRLGGFASAQPATQVFGAPRTTATSSSPFAFGKTNARGAEPAKPTLGFGSPNTVSESAKASLVFNPSNMANGSTKSAGSSSTPQNVNAVIGSAAAAPAPPKFNFGFTKTTAPSPAVGASNSTAIPEPLKAPSTFDFNAFKPSSATSVPAESSTVFNGPPKFKLNIPNASTGESFGATNSLSGALANTAPKPAFGAFENKGAGSGTSNPFSTTPASSPSTVPPKTTFSFGNVNGSTTPSTVNKPADTSKSSISFGGNTTTTPSTSATATGNTPAFSFAFGNPTSSSNNTTTTTPSPFGFGVQPSTDPTANGGTQSVFGKPSTPAPSAFGFGDNNGPSSGSGTFGSAQLGQNQDQQEKK